MKFLSRWGGAFLFLVVTSVYGAIDTYHFENEVSRDRYLQLTESLRCPKCQNQAIADSDAPIAVDLRREVFELIGKGKKDDEIINHLTDRYGDFVLYKPRFNLQTALLWLGPVLFFIFGIGVVWRTARSSVKRERASESSQLTEAEQQRLEKILKEGSQRS